MIRRRQRQGSIGRLCRLALVPWLLSSAHAHADPEKREVPNYDGREDRTTAGDVLLWVPRVILSPLYVVSEFVIRRPLGFLLTAAERAQLPSALYEFFTFGPNHNSGLVPIAFIDFGFEPSVGLLFFSNDIAPHQDLNVHFTTWGEDWLGGAISYTVRLPGALSVGTHFAGHKRPDLAFFGLGPRSVNSARSRYGSTLFEGGFDSALSGARLVHFNAGLGLRTVSFQRGNFDDDPDLRRASNEGHYPLPPGYEDGYTVLYNRLLLSIDSRADSPMRNSGVRLELEGQQESELQHGAGSGFLRYSTALGGFYDLDQHGRVVSLWLSAQFADPLGHGAIPFTELVQLGGAGQMRGFVPGRLIDRSAAVATMRYRWPIWVFLDGSIQFAIGNVFGPHLEDFKPSLLRLSAAIGFESGKADNSLEFLFGLGSETFEHGTQITSVRVVVGTNHGF
ncbi:MAG TPA: BamA/TamA family outer membrane protein [Polyangiales bacterium]